MVEGCRPKRPERAEKSRQRIEERRRRLAAALRENLLRRKEQVRARQADLLPTEDTGQPEHND